MEKTNHDIFSLVEDRPTVARLLLTLNSGLVRVFSMEERRGMLDLLEKTYPEYLTPNQIAKKIGSDNKTVSNALNYLIGSSGLIETTNHSYRLSQELMRPVEGRFEKISYGLSLVIFFAISLGIVLLFNASTLLLPLTYLALCSLTLYAFTKRRRNLLFSLLVAFMLIGETGYVLWAISEPATSRSLGNIANEAGVSLDQVSNLLRDAGYLPVPIEAVPMEGLRTRLTTELAHANSLLRILGSHRGEGASYLQGTAENLKTINTVNLISLYLSADIETRKQIEEKLSRIANSVQGSLKTKRNLLGPRTITIGLEASRAAESESSKLLSIVTS